MNVTHRHKETGVELSARRIEEPVTISLADGEHDFEAGDYEVKKDGAVVMARAEEFEEEFDPIIHADPEPPEAA